jgi:tryptophanyl-tRNA synthetase
MNINKSGGRDMLECLKKIDKKTTGIFATGVLFGTAGIKILSSKDAKNVYTQCTAAVLRAKECVMKLATNIQENAEDIYAEAQQINEERAEQEQVIGGAEEEAEPEVSEEVTE